jgi:hypothetical protein
MALPDSFPPRDPRPVAPGWSWRRGALLLCIAAQLITISALESADPVPATWAAVLLAVAPAPVAALALVTDGQAARLAAALCLVVLVVGIIGEITHTGLFFVPALAVMAVATASSLTAARGKNADHLP